MIVQELHKIQHEWGYLPREQLLALVERLNVGKTDRREETKLYQLHQVASFFPHFRLEPPPVADVRVCRDMACFMHGGPECRAMLEALSGEIGGKQVVVGGVSCLGQCDRPPAVAINDQVYRGKTFDELRQLVQLAARGERLPSQSADSRPLGWQIDPYENQPRYECVRKFAADWQADHDADSRGKRARISDPLLKTFETAKLRGMGGAGFPTFRKWTTVRDCRGDEKYTICNGDESEPGTFKDRELLRRAPHLVIEGITLAGLVTGAARGWIFIRHEYQEEIAAVREALAAARANGASGPRIFGSELSHELEVFVSPGGYICGEETALLEAMEDRRAEPRNKPPLLVFEGFRGKPTVVNNVETYSWVPSILLRGGEWYRDQGTRGCSGLRFVSISGDVVKPGVYEVPFGQTVRELVFEMAGGMTGGRQLKAVATSGPSGGFLPAKCPVATLPKEFVAGLVSRGVLTAADTTFDLLDLPLDSDIMKPFPDMMLGAAFVAYDDRRNMAEQAVNCTEFYRNESCGKCVPCRIGSQKLAQMLRRLIDGQGTLDLELVNDLADAMYQTSICGLGQVVPNGIRSVLRYFRDDLNKYLQPV
jgi:NADH:ubiquinone oxidoreductase subunit F (NADH-binding)/NADH:ubiquinone oxidoreductase subunit E